MAQPAVIVRDLTMRYGPVTAVDGLCLEVAAGRITAVLGRNGAGKSTTMETVAGLRPVQRGSVRVLGHPVTDRRVLAERVGVMLQSGGVPTMARGLAFLRHLARLHSRPTDIDALVEQLDLVTRPVPFRRLSGGQQQRLRLACALVGDPEVLLLDEPSAGLDPVVRERVWDEVRARRDGGACVLLSTHSFEEAEALADDVAVITQGQVRASGSLADLRGPASVRLRLRTVPAAASREDLVRLTAPAAVVDLAPADLRISGDVGPQTIGQVAGWAAAAGLEVIDIGLERRGLREVFDAANAAADDTPGSAA